MLLIQEVLQGSIFLLKILNQDIFLKKKSYLVKFNMQKTIKILTDSSEKYFSPSYSITSRTHITNKALELRLLAGIMEKLRYKIAIKKSKAKNKILYRVLSEDPYKTEHVKDFLFHTGVKYSGPYGPLGADRNGEFKGPSGIIYRGEVLYNLLSGNGTLSFPHGGKMKANWIQGVAFNPQYKFPDGLHYKQNNWKYCTIPDRRFFTEYKQDLKPSGNVQLANDHPARTIPLIHYDTGEGFYGVNTRELIHPITGKFMRLPSKKERKWILNHCRREWVTPLPFNSELYENWFPKFNENNNL